MGNNTNPAEIYSGTTWELLPDNKFLKTGTTPLQQGGSNSIKLTKANLPAEKLQVESFNLTRGTMDITGNINGNYGEPHNPQYKPSGAFYKTDGYTKVNDSGWKYLGAYAFQASRSWTGSTSSASPYTAQMGNGTPLTINPEHITVKAWKRLT